MLPSTQTKVCLKILAEVYQKVTSIATRFLVHRDIILWQNCFSVTNYQEFKARLQGEQNTYMQKKFSLKACFPFDLSNHSKIPTLFPLIKEFIRRIMRCPQYVSQVGEAMFLLDLYKNIQNVDISTKSIT